MNRAELALQTKLIDGLKSQGFYVQRTSERFVAGKPDLRVGKRPFEQIDFELKVLAGGKGVVKSGLAPLQVITIREMNKGGMMACGLVYVEDRDCFYFTVDRELDLDSGVCPVVTREQGKVIDGELMMDTAVAYLERVNGW